MRVNFKKKLLVAIVIIAMLLPQFSAVFAAVDWKTESGSKVYLGVSFRQPNGLYYRVNSNRPIYRAYVGTSNG